MGGKMSHLPHEKHLYHLWPSLQKLEVTAPTVVYVKLGNCLSRCPSAERQLEWSTCGVLKGESILLPFLIWKCTTGQFRFWYFVASDLNSKACSIHATGKSNIDKHDVHWYVVADWPEVEHHIFFITERICLSHWPMEYGTWNWAFSLLPMVCGNSWYFIALLNTICSIPFSADF